MAPSGDACPGQGPGDGSSRYMPIAPDPVKLTTEAADRAAEVFRRELLSLRETIETRLDAADEDREQIRVRLRDLPALYETFTSHLRAELLRQDAHDREILVQRLDDLDAANQAIAGHTADSIAETREVAAAAVTGLRELIGQRLDTVEKFPADLSTAAGSVREVVLGEIRRVLDITTEKFAAVDALFASNARALAAALAAQEKAVAEQNRSSTLAISKSESTTKETIALNATQAQTGLASLADQFADIKERVVRIESTGAGITANKTEAQQERTLQHSGSQLSIATIAVIIAVISIAVTVILATRSH